VKPEKAAQRRRIKAAGGAWRKATIGVIAAARRREQWRHENGIGDNGDSIIENGISSGSGIETSKRSNAAINAWSERGTAWRNGGSNGISKYRRHGSGWRGENRGGGAAW